MTFCFHKWIRNRNSSTRNCRKCDKKEINLWGHWSEVKNQRDLELYDSHNEGE